MAFTARDVMQRASTILQDSQATRWTPPELFAYLGDGIREVVTKKPNAKSGYVTLALAQGTLQTLPANYTMLSRVTRNLTVAHDQPGGPVGGGAIRPIDRMILDAQIPGWQSTTTLPFSATVIHVIHDMAAPRQFYVVPGNTGAGKIEAVVGMYPADTPAPAPASILDITAYTGAVDLPDTYRNALVDYVIYRAFSKDAGNANASARAQAHFALFNAAIDTITAGEGAMSLGAQPGPAS